MVKEVLRVTNGGPGTFIMKQVPDAPGNLSPGTYTLQTTMHMLPPRCLGEGAFAELFDGLYLVTLVDERYWLQGTPITLKIRQNTTWAQVISQIANAGKITITNSTIENVYFQPEPDSQLWLNEESVATLLDAVAYNLGRVVVRNLSGTYSLLTATESLTRVRNNTPTARRTGRVAGGDIFLSGTRLPVGSLFKSKNSVVAPTVRVTFPHYVQGNDPVPHLVNPRYQVQRPSAWYEDSYGSVYSISVPISSGGSLVSGVTGVSGQIQALHCTAKALCSGDAQAVSGSHPLNRSGLTSLAMQLAKNYWEGQVLTALDEVFPGTYAWSPEGVHDLVWTYSARQRLAALRVVKSEWNIAPTEFQHATPPLSGYTNTPKGVGGPSVALTVRDEISRGYNGFLSSGGLTSGGIFLNLLSTANLPTNRWRALINSGEIVLAEGQVIIYRGIDGTIQQAHSGTIPVSQLLPNTVYGTNLTTYGQGFSVRQGYWTSGGISEAHISFQVPPPVTSGDPFCASGMDVTTAYIPLCGSGGSLEVWQREQYQTIDGGCLSVIKAPWSFYSDLCVPCTCSGQQPPADLYWCVQSGSTTSCLALGTTPPTAVTGPHQNPEDCSEQCQTYWWCVSNGGDFHCVQSVTQPAGAVAVYDTEEECESGCSQISPPPLPPCPPIFFCDACINPDIKTPIAWTLYLSQFTGVCSPIQGEWVLTQGPECTWGQIRPDGSMVTLKIAVGLMVLRLFVIIGGSPVKVALYQKAIGVIDCCVPHTVTKDITEDDCDISPETVTLNPICCDGGDPMLFWWCVNDSTCVEAISAPDGTTSGPYATQALCTAACGSSEPFPCPCVSTPLPFNLTANFINLSNCACIQGLNTGLAETLQDVHVGQIDGWCTNPQATLYLELNCDESENYVLDWVVSDPDDLACTASGTASVLLNAPYTPSCSPVSLYFEITFPNECCPPASGGSATIRVHITE